MNSKRKYSVGAEVLSKGVHFRVWAPSCDHVELVLEDHEPIPLKKEQNHFFSAMVEYAKSGMLYQFCLNHNPVLFPDPASYFQPKGPNGPSCIIDLNHFPYHEDTWKGISNLKNEVIYELHIGTFTQEGTWKAAIKKLQDLVDLGITIIEMMPIADFTGEFGWGYDGVNLFAPTRLYGTPEDLREFIYRAHQLKIGVILDVVYNHIGSSGDTLSNFSQYYFTDRYKTDWGKAINFDGEYSKSVRDFFITNAIYWMQEYHFDGLRIDATQNIYDSSSPHILKEMSQKIKKHFKSRHVVLIAENESQNIQLVHSFDKNGYEFDAVWNDDFHHSAMVHLTGRKEAYYLDYNGFPQEFISSLKYGYLYQGQFYSWQNKDRGTSSLDIPFEKYVIFLQNHDQIANFFRSFRLHQITHGALLRIFTTLLLLSPQIPLLFQGQEFAASSPFYFFSDLPPEINKQVWEGRRKFLIQFPTWKEEMQNIFQDPSDSQSFQNSKLRWEEKNQEMHKEIFLLHKDLLQLRKKDPVFSAILKVEGATITSNLFLLRYFGKEDDRLLIFNLGNDFSTSIPDPLIAPPNKKIWKLLFSSQNPIYGGIGTPSLDNFNKVIPGHTALIYKTLPGNLHD